ncbi:TonB-dependent receptor [Sphingobium chlorophenolicum L-1]|uniref:TonB-dependent receptor n=1 Tax=Sphingobium chlorophenolicum L-1 TaxID=690566 RepID=F6EUF6_SPHCR|nr:TonB-dependent receptor [Sphingobium chlorophenolicum]AEG47850.1 TonB-dependent receptor [Sphingobium chlorophenolicum L-1]
MHRRLTAAAFAALSCLPGVAWAQRANDNAVTEAKDAFGSSVGNESIGLYSPSQIRGFSPVTAGNVRIEGVYIDRQGVISQRLVDGSTIRVGLSAQGYPFPAPTGIVDYRLRGVGERRLVSVVAGSLAYGAPSIEVDAQLPIDGRRLGVALSASYAHEEYYDGSDAHYSRFAVIPRWRPSDGVEVIPFWSMSVGRDEQVAPTIIAAGAFEPTQAPRRRYFGQEWAIRDSRSINAGAIVKARIGESWAVSGGVFRSSAENEQNFAELFVGTTRDGITTEQIIADPGQRYASTSGELRISRSLKDGPRLHTLHASVRMRQLDSRYGGGAPALDLGPRRLGDPVPVPEPATFLFGDPTRDRVRQITLGLAYEGRWRDVGELSLGVQRTDYRKTIDLPGVAPDAERRDRPWLFNVAAAGYVSDRLAVYAGYTRGLEESGIAPINAANRNEALPAIRTSQADAGIRWTLNKRMKLVAGVFDVRKPYFNTDEANVFTTLGDVRHRGAEISLAGNPVDSVSLIAGAVLMQPRVTGQGVQLGRVGEIPLNQPARVLRANVEWRPSFLPGFSIDGAIANFGRRAASRENTVFVPSYTLVDLGLRYRFKIGDAPATLRFQVANVTNTFSWNIVGSNSYGMTDKRRMLLFLAADF